MEDLRYNKKPKFRFQIEANTGETLGTPLETFEIAESTIQAIINKEISLQELCPDSDLSLITELVIIPTQDY